MTINVTMSKEEFLEYNSYKELKNTMKCGIIDLKDNYNSLLKLLLEDEIWKDNNKYGKVINKINDNLSSLERGCD